MHVLLVIIGIHATLIGFGLLFAGFMSLCAPDEKEIEATREQFRNERAKGKLRYTLFCLGQMSQLQQQSKGIALAVSHWPTRPKCRRMIYVGVACLATAAAIGYKLGTFDSDTNHVLTRHNRRKHITFDLPNR